ncbi:hypothetical protein COV58_01550 [Candidatus Roizmanbacteria bacterium CG11_big_fil_rev_8_21_14_0_20_36_8]|uniref:EamA domain-containing protein n=2 Tax=Candidatus Roizmaniibacteriota TaxID=1752723 RepID=A0A2M6IUW8_9BACT|nr:MAG: hypothetical protein COV58_01550 [Candidatus Roizmanbacteria bacterium CG11_big_fil_rev_8_21_14_0_20_36_8]PIZ62041.1 MAG: hypothetical protein COY16_05415 [Candidatus Roizmanbacteria bacterium CG_4_10_14_0_2_um_filter_39_13]
MTYIIVALLLYTATIILGAYASRHADSNLVTAIMNTMSAILPLAIIVPYFSKINVQNSKYGIIAAIIAGATIALFTLSLNKSFTVNKVGIVTPIVFGGAIFLSTILSAILFKEKVSMIQGFGLTFLGIGFIIVTYARWVGK